MRSTVRSMFALTLVLGACAPSGADEEGGGRLGPGGRRAGSPGTGDASTVGDAGPSTNRPPATAVTGTPGDAATARSGDAATPRSGDAATPGSGNAGPGAAGDAATPGVVVGTGSVGVSSCGAASGLGSFKASNLPLDLALKQYKALHISHATTIDTDALAFTGTWAEEGAPLQLVSTPDGELAVLYVDSFTTSTGGSLAISGQRPFVLLAAKTIEHAGIITTVSSAANGYAAGGATGVRGAERRGFGPGGGAPGNAMMAASGGSYCGLGGIPTGSAVMPAPAYGTPTLTPLLGGSSGGSATGGSAAAGGAIELVAGLSLVIKETGTVNARGYGAQGHAGGSSGGAILLEAPEVTVLGVVAANGASGGGDLFDGTAGTITGTPATQPQRPNVGAGSAGASINGGMGVDAKSAGGGGSGRIRLNAACPLKVDANSVLTPSKGTSCYSEGSLLAR